MKRDLINEYLHIYHAYWRRKRERERESSKFWWRLLTRNKIFPSSMHALLLDIEQIRGLIFHFHSCLLNRHWTNSWLSFELYVSACILFIAIILYRFVLHLAIWIWSLLIVNMRIGTKLVHPLKWFFSDCTPLWLHCPHFTLPKHRLMIYFIEFLSSFNIRWRIKYLFHSFLHMPRSEFKVSLFKNIFKYWTFHRFSFFR